MTPAAVGFAPHSGWAALVALGGDARSPQVVLRERIEMADPALDGSVQPYHAAADLPIDQARALLERLGRSATALAAKAVRSAVEEMKGRGYGAGACAILEGSGRRGASLESILASHPMIHTADGNHFRDALAQASERCGLAVARVPAAKLLDVAATALRLPAADVQKRVASLGKSVGPPWGADQKSAALAAWLLLARG